MSKEPLYPHVPKGIVTHFSTDEATKYVVTVEVETGVRWDNPAAQMAIHEAISKGKYDLVQIQPITNDEERRQYLQAIEKAKRPLRRWETTG